MAELYSLRLNTLTPQLLEWLAQCPKLTELRFTQIHKEINDMTAAHVQLSTIKNFACERWGGNYLKFLPKWMPNLEIIVFGDAEQTDFAVEVQQLEEFDLESWAFATKYFLLYRNLQVLFIDGHVMYMK